MRKILFLIAGLLFSSSLIAGELSYKYQFTYVTANSLCDKYNYVPGFKFYSLYGGYTKLNGISIGTSMLKTNNLEFGLEYTLCKASCWNNGQNVNKLSHISPTESLSAFYEGAYTYINGFHLYTNYSQSVFTYKMIYKIRIYGGLDLSAGIFSNYLKASFANVGGFIQLSTMDNFYNYNRLYIGGGLRYGVTLDTPINNLGVNIGGMYSYSKVQQKGFIYDKTFTSNRIDIGIFYKIRQFSRRILR
jgi:hypothetical protein